MGGWRECGAEAETKLCGSFAVAGETKGTEIVQIALASTFGDGADVVGIPEGAAAGDGLHAVEAEAGDTGGSTGTFEGVVDGDGLGVADGADAVVAGEDLIAEIAGIGAEPPLVDAVVGAEGTASFGEDFEFAPTAEGEAVGSAGEGLGLGAAAGKGAGGKHCCFSFTTRER